MLFLDDFFKNINGFVVFSNSRVWFLHRFFLGVMMDNLGRNKWNFGSSNGHLTAYKSFAGGGGGVTFGCPNGQVKKIQKVIDQGLARKDFGNQVLLELRRKKNHWKCLFFFVCFFGVELLEVLPQKLSQ